MNPEPGQEPLRRIPTKHAQEARGDVGPTLKAARLKKGLPYETVAQQTRIPKRYLEALENNRFEEFPALVYLRGFLKGYCDFLELDFESLWKSVTAEPGAENEGNGGQKPPEAGTTAPTRTPPKTPLPPKATPPSGALPLILGLGVTLALAVWLGRPAPRTPGKEETPAALRPFASPVEPRLVVEFRKDTWVSIAVDGSVRFEGRVPQGARQEWKAKKSLALRAADPESLRLTLNDAPYPLPAPDSSGAYLIESSQ